MLNWIRVVWLLNKWLTMCKQEMVLMLNWIVWNRPVFTFNSVFILEKKISETI